MTNDINQIKAVPLNQVWVRLKEKLMDYRLRR